MLGGVVRSELVLMMVRAPDTLGQQVVLAMSRRGRLRPQHKTALNAVHGNKVGGSGLSGLQDPSLDAHAHSYSIGRRQAASQWRSSVNGAHRLLLRLLLGMVNMVVLVCLVVGRQARFKRRRKGRARL